MTEPRAAAGLLVSALIRTIEAEGGQAMVLARGDAAAGAILLLIANRGLPQVLLERMPGLNRPELVAIGPADAVERDAYIARRRRNDPDMWIVELDHDRARDLAIALLT